MPRYIAWPTILIAVVVGAASAATALKPARIVARIATGQTRCSENGGLGALRVSNFRDATIARIDPTTNRVTGRIKVGPQPCGVVVGAGALWVDGYGTGSVERVDPQTSQIVPADSRRSEPVGRRVRSRRRLGDQRVQRDRFPNRLGDRRDRSDHQGGHGTTSGPVRGGRDLGREPRRQEHLPRRPVDEQGARRAGRSPLSRFDRGQRCRDLGDVQRGPGRSPLELEDAARRGSRHGRPGLEQRGDCRRRERVRPEQRRRHGEPDRSGPEQGRGHVQGRTEPLPSGAFGDVWVPVSGGRQVVRFHVG
jgi:YVTN family beta-propeller protein